MRQRGKGEEGSRVEETAGGCACVHVVAVLLCTTTKQDESEVNCQDVSQSAQGGDKSRQTYQSLQSILELTVYPLCKDQ